MNYIFNLGVPREKIVFGMAAYGRSTILVDMNCAAEDGSRVGCEISGTGKSFSHAPMQFLVMILPNFIAIPLNRPHGLSRGSWQRTVLSN